MLCLCETVSLRVARVKLFRLPQLSSLPPSSSFLPLSFVIPAKAGTQRGRVRSFTLREIEACPELLERGKRVPAVRPFHRPTPIHPLPSRTPRGRFAIPFALSLSKGHHPATNPSPHAAPPATLPTWKRHPTRTAPPTPTMTPHGDHHFCLARRPYLVQM